MPTDIHEHRFDTGQVVLHYAETPGPGTPLVLLHGGSARWQSFEDIWADLAADHHLYAPDLRGHGRSAWATGTYRLRDYTDDIVRFLQAVVGRPALVFGHSLGGMVALMAAAQYPAGVRAVAVGDAPLSQHTWRAPLRDSQERLMAWRALAGGQLPLDEVIEAIKNSPVEVPGQAGPTTLRQLYGEGSGVFAWLGTSLYQQDPDMLTAILERFEATGAGYEIGPLLGGLACPVLLLQADPAAGGLMADADVAEAFACQPKAQHKRLAGVGHVLHNQQPAVVVAALRAFFATASAGKSV